jgi:hypothetical protein
MRFSRPPALVIALFTAGLLACRIETRPPAEVERVQATIYSAVNEHYRARGALLGDSAAFRVTRRQTEVRRDLASVWITVRQSERVSPDSLRDTTRYEHLLLRRNEGGWIVLSATGVTPP